MNDIRVFLVADHINALLAESASNRQAKIARRADRLSRRDSLVQTVRSLLATPTDTPRVLPKLSDYPYRS